VLSQLNRFRLVSAALVAAFVPVLCAPLSAQWLKVPSAGLPRLPDGKPNLAAPAPKSADGKPDLSGIWMPVFKNVVDIANELKPGEVPFRPWSQELYQQRLGNESKDDPTGHCIPGGVPRADSVPYPFKILNTAGMTIILYEAVHSYRQIFMDGRQLPKDPNPTWMGYSVGKWDGDTLVVDTAGFVENSWLDNNGHPGTESLHVTERFHRPDVGHLDIRVTIDDPKAYTKPWTVNLPLTLLPDTELLEYVCNENNKDLEHLVGK
jgi:hypothetical protein